MYRAVCIGMRDPSPIARSARGAQVSGGPAPIPTDMSLSIRLQNRYVRTLSFLVVLALVLGITPSLSAATGTDDIVWAPANDRSKAARLHGATVKTNIHVFTKSETFKRVDFYIDDPKRQRAPYRVERYAPFDLRGGPAFDTTTLPEGQHVITAVLIRRDGSRRVATSHFTVDNVADPTPATTAENAADAILWAPAKDRSKAASLNGATVAGSIDVFTQSEAFKRVDFYVDDPERQGTPYQVERYAPFDLRGGPAFDTTTLSDGEHVVTAATVATNGSQTLYHASFHVNNGSANVGTSAPQVPSETPESPTEPVPTTPAPEPIGSETPPAPEPIGSETPDAGVATPLGLHFTAEELAVWRDRARSGPYKTQGDVTTNSPGDWERIVSNKNAFLADPKMGNRYNGPSVSGCVTQGSRPGPDTNGAARLRDAAFYALITDDAATRQAARAELLQQAKLSGVDFSNRARWCAEKWPNASSPGYQIGTWLTKLLYAYDYIGSENFTAAERSLLNDWFYEAANYWRIDVNHYKAQYLPNRWQGDYSAVTSKASSGGVSYGYRDGSGNSDPIYGISRSYNNRVFRVTRFVGVAAQKLANEGYTPPPAANNMSVEDLKKTAKLYVKEWLMFGVYPEGMFGEFERWTYDHPAKGLHYAGMSLGHALTVATTFARHGDSELMDFVTREGTYVNNGTLNTTGLGTANSAATGDEPAKSLRFAIETMGDYVAQKGGDSFPQPRYSPAGSVGDSKFLLTGEEPQNGWWMLDDVITVQAATYYNSPEISDVYRRSGEGMWGYPSKLPGGQYSSAWEGDIGAYPAMLFMFGQMEGKVRPY